MGLRRYHVEEAIKINYAKNLFHWLFTDRPGRFTDFHWLFSKNPFFHWLSLTVDTLQDVELGKIWWNMGEREFSADSEYRIRFFISFTVLELLDYLWTSVWPFWPKMPTLWMNISRTEQAFDVRFFSAGLYRSPLHSDQKLSKWEKRFIN